MSHPLTAKPRRTRRRPDAAPPPINVWPAWLAQQSSRNSSHEEAGFSPAVAARLACTYTRPGDLIVALHHHLAVAEAADWFARKAALLVTDRHQQEIIGRRVQPMLTPTRRATVRVICADEDRRARLLEGSHGRAAMIIVVAPEWSNSNDPYRSATQRMQRLLHACEAALRPGGHLVVHVPSIDETGTFIDRATEVIATARATCLIYLQHLVVINDCLSEQDVVPEPVPPRSARPAPSGRRQHIDLYVFSKPGASDV